MADVCRGRQAMKSRALRRATKLRSDIMVRGRRGRGKHVQDMSEQVELEPKAAKEAQVMFLSEC